MTAAELVNRIVEKLGGNRVEFIEIDVFETPLGDCEEVRFAHAGNLYNARSVDGLENICVSQEVREQGPLETNNYSQWIEGVLNGMVRDDAGVLS